jgi:hypothetical protein
MRTLTLAVGFTIAVTTAASAATSPDQQIGAAAKVVNSVYGTPESTNQSHWLRPGLDVFQNEMIVSQENSASRVVFKDDSQLSIGPIAQVKLDTFVYNPNPTAGGVAISFVKGAFRFTSGHFGKENYSIQTPAASIAVRGTAFTVAILQDGGEFISVESGTIFVTCHQGITVALNAGQMTYIKGPQGGAGPAQPAIPVPAVNQMDALLH